MHRHWNGHPSIDEHLCGDVEYVVHAHTDRDGAWVIEVDAYELDLDPDGNATAVHTLDSHATDTALPAHPWNAEKADAALRAIGFERVEPWDLRRTSPLTAHTQAVTSHVPLLVAS